MQMIKRLALIWVQVQPLPQVCDLKNARGGDYSGQETETPGRHALPNNGVVPGHITLFSKCQAGTTSRLQGKATAYDILETPQRQCSSSLPFQVGSAVSVHGIIPKGPLRRGAHTQDLAFCRGKDACSSKPTRVCRKLRGRTQSRATYVGKPPASRIAVS